MDVVIFEGDEQTGRADLDERTFEYHGDSEHIHATLTRMKDGEITMTRPTTPNDEAEPGGENDGPTFESKPDPEDASHRDGVEVAAITGKLLGRHLRKALTNRPQGEDVRVEAVDGTLDAERIALDETAETTASDDASDAGDGEDDGEEPLSEVSFEATYGPPSEQPDTEE